MKSFKKLKNNKGEGYIDLLISMGIIFFITYMCILLFPVFIAKQNINYMAKTIVKTIEITGENGNYLNDEIKHLKDETKCNPDIEITGNFNDGKLQLREKFSVVLTDSIDIIIAKTIFGNELKITIPLNKSLSGMSEVYFKD